MSFLHRSEIEKLLRVSGGPCISLMMPTVRAGDTQQNAIRFKNLLRDIEKRLQERGLKGPELDSLLAPLAELEGDRAFWEHQDEGLAVFRSPDFFKTLRLPLAFKELAMVNDRFHVKSIFPLLSGDGHFYILALSLKNARLIEASRHHAREIDLVEAGVPHSFREALGDLERRSSQFQSSTSSKTVSRSPLFPGHGTAEDDLKAEIFNYFRRLDDGLKGLIDRDAPVVLAGVEYLLPRFREASQHPHICDEALTGNAEGLKPEELRDHAWPIVEPHFLKDRQRAEARFRELAGTGLASANPEEVLPAAHDGRVEALFTARGVRLWGQYDEGSREIQLQPEQQAQDQESQDLLDLAAIQTFLNGGSVFAVEKEEIPNGEELAAVFRY
ncbi:MAG TPA: hypothetical protein VHU81_02020 [Thermoanaerobaculia bacterium]|jgi:hypothetical protein|nr:hypothetical protein [Thermoanaerobaculia bacterium]